MTVSGTSLKRPYSGHELDYIPFAKSSNTFVKQAGSSTVTVEDQWLSDHWDDAKVPGMTEVDYECHRSSPVDRRVDDGSDSGGVSNNTLARGSLTLAPGILMGPESYQNRPSSPRPSSIHNNNCSNNTAQSRVNIGHDLKQSLLQRQAHFQQQQCLPQQPQQSVPDQCGGIGSIGSSEIVVEMPPPVLGNRKPRKPSGPWSLNNRYARMMRDMELIAQDTMIQQSTDATMCVEGGPATCNPTFNYGTLAYHPGHYDPMASANASYNGGMASSSSSGPDNASQPIRGYYAEQPYTCANSTVPSTMTMAAAPSSNKRVRFERSPSLSTSVINPNPLIGCGAYSTPHFRFSSGSNSSVLGRTGQETHEPQLTSNSIFAQQSPDDGFDDDPLFEKALLEHELLFDDPVPEATSQPYLSPTRPYSTQPQDVASQESIDVQANHQQGDDNNNSNDHYKIPGYVLDQRPLTIRDRIRKMGSEIRASASATIPRFGIVTPYSYSLDIRQKRDVEREREKQQLRQKSRFQSSDHHNDHEDTNIHSEEHLLGTQQEPLTPCGGGIKETLGTEDTCTLTSSNPNDDSQASGLSRSRWEMGASKDANMTTQKMRMALPTPLPSIDENSMLSTALSTTKDRGETDIDRIATLEREIRDLTTFVKQR